VEHDPPLRAPQSTNENAAGDEADEWPGDNDRREVIDGKRGRNKKPAEKRAGTCPDNPGMAEHLYDAFGRRCHEHRIGGMKSGLSPSPRLRRPGKTRLCDRCDCVYSAQV